MQWKPARRGIQGLRRGVAAAHLVLVLQEARLNESGFKCGERRSALLAVAKSLYSRLCEYLSETRARLAGDSARGRDLVGSQPRHDTSKSSPADVRGGDRLGPHLQGFQNSVLRRAHSRQRGGESLQLRNSLRHQGKLAPTSRPLAQGLLRETQVYVRTTVFLGFVGGATAFLKRPIVRPLSPLR